jgi:chemotaxis signal transduction protein
MADFSGVRLLVFRVADVACAAEAARVREILSVPPVTRVPGAPQPVAGVANAAESPGSSIVLLDVGSRTVGFVVDEVIDLIAMPAAGLADRQELPGVDPAVVRAVGRQADLSFVLLDFDALLGPIFPT